MQAAVLSVDLKKAFDSVETEAVIKALATQGAPTLCITVLQELYGAFTRKTDQHSTMLPSIVKNGRIQ